MTLYSDLGVKPDATTEEIKKAFKQKASTIHPDRENGNKKAFQKIQHAYQILKNKQKRLEYDAKGYDADPQTLGKQEQAVIKVMERYFSLLQDKRFAPNIDYFTIIRNEINSGKQHLVSQIMQHETNIVSFKKIIGISSGPGLKSFLELKLLSMENEVKRLKEDCEFLNTVSEVLKDFNIDKVITISPTITVDQTTWSSRVSW